MAMMTQMAEELRQESQSTERVLDAIPEEQLEWRPHETSMSLGQLAFHVASTPGNVAQLMSMDEVPPPEFGNLPQPGSKAEVLDAFRESMQTAAGVLEGMDDATAAGMWSVVHEGQTLMQMPRAALARAIMLNHWYHHRGQLLVYLRMLGTPVPAVYGASRDENPFAQA